MAFKGEVGVKRLLLSLAPLEKVLQAKGSRAAFSGGEKRRFCQQLNSISRGYDSERASVLSLARRANGAANPAVGQAQSQN